MVDEICGGGYPGFLQSWYVDDFRMVCAGTKTKPTIAHIEAMETTCGLFIKPEKSRFLWSPGVSEEAGKVSPSPIRLNPQVGGAVSNFWRGCDKSKQRWVERKVETWVAGVNPPLPTLRQWRPHVAYLSNRRSHGFCDPRGSQRRQERLAPAPLD